MSSDTCAKVLLHFGLLIDVLDEDKFQIYIYKIVKVLITIIVTPN